MPLKFLQRLSGSLGHKSFNESCKSRSIDPADRTSKRAMNSEWWAAKSPKPPSGLTAMLASSQSSRRQGAMSAGSATLETRSIHHEMFELLVSTKLQMCFDARVCVSVTSLVRPRSCKCSTARIMLPANALEVVLLVEVAFGLGWTVVATWPQNLEQSPPFLMKTRPSGQKIGSSCSPLHSVNSRRLLLKNIPRSLDEWFPLTLLGLADQSSSMFATHQHSG